MANEKLIDAFPLMQNGWHLVKTGKSNEFLASMSLADVPQVDAVSRGLHDLVRWERDVAIKQLEEHGIPFGGKAPDVVKVFRCKDCEHYTSRESCLKHRMIDPNPNDFCSYGERRDA